VKAPEVVPVVIGKQAVPAKPHGKIVTSVRLPTITSMSAIIRDTCTCHQLVQGLSQALGQFLDPQGIEQSH